MDFFLDNIFNFNNLKPYLFHWKVAIKMASDKRVYLYVECIFQSHKLATLNRFSSLKLGGYIQDHKLSSSLNKWQKDQTYLIKAAHFK